MIENNIIPTQNYNKVNPFSKVDTANGMPINNLRVIEPVNNSLKSKEFVEKQNLRDVFAKSLAPSIGYDTEKFIKAKNLMSPVYSYNEAVSKYDMISRIHSKNKDLSSQINLLA